MTIQQKAELGKRVTTKPRLLDSIDPEDQRLYSAVLSVKLPPEVYQVPAPTTRSDCADDSQVAA